MKRLIALVLSVCLLLCGCSALDFGGYFENLISTITGVQDFSKMEYVRPDMDALERELDALCAQAATERDLEVLTQKIWDFYGLYDGFSTAYSLALIHYYQDLTSTYWEEEYAFCTEHAGEADAALDKLYRALAKSPLREKLEGHDYFGPDYFDTFEGESMYDEMLLALMEKEAKVLSQYYAVNSQSIGMDPYSEAYLSQYGPQLTNILVELVQVRQEMAAYCGYSSYPEFSYDFYYYRDYTIQQTTSYLADIRAQLTPLYTELLQSDLWDSAAVAVSEAETFSYLSTMAKNMGGLVEEAFLVMQKGHLYDIAYGENKYNVSFEVYLPSYYVPFVFVNPMGNAFDMLTFAHEFGHFCSDYISYGSIAGVDVAEVFSQGMEYLSLCYADNGEELTTLKLADCLCLYVEQAALASFEQQLYGLTGDALTPENIETLYAEVCDAYGISGENWDSRSYVTIGHYFTNPMYLISYVVSNDAALQLYQLELTQKGKGLSCLELNLSTNQGQFLAFLKISGLQSPFTTGRLTSVKELLQQSLLNQ
jgi:oligoendopeptidase F